MAKANLGILVFFYCLKTLGWVATTIGVFLTFRYLHSWLHSAWKKEMQRSFQSKNRDVGEDEYAQEDSNSIDRIERSVVADNEISHKSDL